MTYWTRWTVASRSLVRSAIGRPHGFFTGALLAALRDEATDRNADGTLQSGELVDAVTTRVVRASRGLQTPWVARRELFGEFGVARAPAARSERAP